MTAHAVARGDRWICGVGQDAGNRPIAVISVDALNDIRQKIIAVVGTHTVRNLPTEVPIGKEEGLLFEGVLSAADILTIDRRLLSRKAGQLSPSKLAALEESIRLVLDL